MAQLKDLLVTGDERIVGNSYNNSPKVAYGTCATAAATAAKEIVVADPAWNLQVGDIVGVKFTNSNSASSCTLNVNSTGAKSIWYNTSVYTGTGTHVCGTANRYNYYMYDGTYWVWLSYSNDANDNSNTIPSAYCDTAAGTAAKVASCTGYNLLSKSFLHVIIVNTNTSASAITLNVNGKGAKTIYINGTASSSSNYSLTAGSYLVYYDGTNYYFRTDGKLTASITGDAATVNGKTVAVNVPADAKFTDNNTTYTFANGTNGFSVTPSGGTAQTVTVTPSITNNVTGSGTSGYLTKFNGANSITNGPQLGSSTSTYLRNDATWVNPQNVYVGASAPSGSNYQVWIDTTGADDLTAIINAVYPVNSIYISVSSTNPATIFGVGTWVAWGSGRVPVGVNTSDTDFDTVEKTGGSKYMQSHYHDLRYGAYDGSGVTISNTGAGARVLDISSWNWSNNILNSKGSGSNVYTNAEGTGSSGNLQPYITCYMWKRTA